MTLIDRDLDRVCLSCGERRVPVYSSISICDECIPRQDSMSNTTSGDPVYILNVNPGGMDVLHLQKGLTEACNTDDILDRSTVDAETADALASMGEARRCEHCLGDER